MLHLIPLAGAVITVIAAPLAAVFAAGVIGATYLLAALLDRFINR